MSATTGTRLTKKQLLGDPNRKPPKVISPSDPCSNIIRIPCHTMRMVANERNIEYPKRRNSGSYVVSSVVIACWIVPTIASCPCGPIVYS